MTIPILDNVVVADSTLFSVVLTSADHAVVLFPTTADVTIEDNDCELSSCGSVLAVQDFTTYCFINSVVTIGFNPATYSVAEYEGNVSVTVSVQNGTLARLLSVAFSLEGTATGGIVFEAFMCS